MITPGDMTSADDSSSWSNSLFTIQYIGNVGSVGIGLSNPAYKLHVAGDTMITSMTWGSGSTVTLNLGDTNQAIQAVYGTGMVFKTYGPGGENSFIWKRSGGQQLMLLSADSGNLGIATNTPGSMLQVANNVAIGITSSTVAPMLGLYVNGSVGIGISNPSQPGAKLDVNGTIRTNAYLDVNGPRILSGKGNPNTIPQPATQGSLFIQTDANSATNRLWINRDGTPSGWSSITASS